MSAQDLSSVTEFETWKVDHRLASHAHELELWCAEALQVPQKLDAIWAKRKSQLFAGEIRDLEDEGRRAREAFQDLLKRLTQAQGAIAGLQKAGYAVRGADHVDGVKQRITALISDFEASWPFYDEKLSGEAMQQYRRGEFASPGDLLNGAGRQDCAGN